MAVERSREFIIAALFLSRCGQKLEGQKPLPPVELGTDNWQRAYAAFFDQLGAGRALRAFHNSLKASRDQFDSHVDSGRRGWLVNGQPKPLPELDAKVLEEWRSRSNNELWEKVRAWVDSDIATVPASILSDLEAETEDDEEQVFVGREGKLKVVVSRRRERSPKLRTAALRLHGYRCQVCEFDFGEFYGDWGEGFAEVHHMQELGTTDIDGVDTKPATDLAVLCSNCHRMVHRKPKRALTLAELRDIVQSVRAARSDSGVG